MATQRDIALNMIQQLRLLDPSVSAEIGTPERKIIDTVASLVSDSQIDLAQLEGVFDLDAKFGSDLEAFVSIFGFGRQKGTQATGYVKFSRVVPSAYVVPIPNGTQMVAPSVILDGGATPSLIFQTTGYAEIPIGQLSVVAPVRCVQVGPTGNVAANSITQFSRTPILGITSVTNEIPTTGGVAPETDAELKTRFKNTIFRNLAGTYDQFLAVAASTNFTTKANVVGPISRYREYIQVPDVDDATADPDSLISGNGVGGSWSTALSTIPYSKHTYDDIPYFVSNGESGLSAIFYRRDLDFTLNTDARNKGDAFRQSVDFNDPETDFQPSITFRNVITDAADTESEGLRPGQVALFEHSYMSDVSRNDYDRQILNCVDVFINGENPTLADAVIPKPAGTNNLFTASPTNAYYFDNYRRKGSPHRRPVQGNIFSGLYWNPVTDLPDEIATADAIFYKDIHYWAVEDVSEIGGTIRSRDGIEWNPTVAGRAPADPEAGPFTGPAISSSTATSISVTGYLYDRNIVDLQVALEGNKQVTTDVLGHRSRTRYLKLDLTVMYSPGLSTAAVNTAIHDALDRFFAGQYFGTVIQMSDLLQVVHNVAGVDNVRWSRDLTATRNQVVECDAEGNPTLGMLIDRRTYGATGATEVQQGYFTGTPTGGTFTMRYLLGPSTAPIAYNASAATVQLALEAVSIPVTVSGSGTPSSPFLFTFTSNGFRSLLTVNPTLLTGDDSVFNADFYLQDDELPALPTGLVSGDATAGVIIRPKAQNTWQML